MIINWRPNKLAKISLHIQITEYFKKMIKNGYWVNGEKFPSQRKLAEILNVNRSTVVLAMEELKAQGFVITSGKGGTLVSTNNWINITENSDNMLNNLLSLGILKRKSEIYKKIEENYNLVKVDFGKGELDESLYPTDDMKKMMSKAVNEINTLSYENENGDEELINQIKYKMTKLGVNMEHNDILIVSGATQGLFIIVFGMLSKDTFIKTNMPCYVKSLEIFKSAGLKIEDILSSKSGLYNVFYMIPSFHNPTGKLMGINDRKIFMNKYGRHNSIIEDDVFRDLWYDSPSPKPLKAYNGGENVIYISSFSKTLAPGLRIGWICASKKVIKKLKEIKYQIDYGTSIVNQKIVAKWLNSPEYDKNIKKVRETLKKRRDLIRLILEKDFKELFSWNIPNGGYYYWIESKDKIRALTIFEKSLKYGLVIHPGELYGEEDSCCMRISFANSNEKKIKEGFKILRKVMNNLKYGL